MNRAPKPTAYYAEPRFSIWTWFGFGARAAPRPDTDEYLAGFAPSWLTVRTTISLCWRDRLRILISGRASLDIAVKTDRLVRHSRATAAFGVLPPGPRQ